MRVDLFTRCYVWGLDVLFLVPFLPRQYPRFIAAHRRFL